MVVDLKNVNLGQRIAAAGGVLLFVFLFIGWYTLGGSVGVVAGQLGVDVSISGWDAHTLLRWLMLLTIVAAVGLAVLVATGRSIPDLTVSGSAVVAGLGAVTAILLAFRMFVNQPGPDTLIDLRFGAWIGLVALVAIAVGGWLSMQEEGTSVHAVGRQLRRAFDHTHHQPPGAPTS